MEREALLSDPKILGLPIGAWITAAVGIGVSVYFYRKKKNEEVEVEKTQEIPLSEPLGFQALSGSPYGTGGFTPGSVQVGEGEAGKRSELAPTSAPPKRETRVPGQTPPIINPISNPIAEKRIEVPRPIPIIRQPPVITKEKTFEPGWIIEQRGSRVPIEDLATIHSEAKSYVVNGGGPPKPKITTQAELVVTNGR